MNKEILNKLRQFDAYPKTLDDFRIKTFSGATGGASKYIICLQH